MPLITEYHWNAQKDALRRIRDDLSASDSNSVSPADQKRHLLAKYSPEVTEYSNHRRFTPHNLPRLNTPPSHEKRRSTKNLREKKFTRVPSVVPRLTFDESTSDTNGDSWGEEDESDNEPNNPQFIHPFSYPMPYFIPPPGALYPPPPVAFYYPTFPQSGVVTPGRKKKKAMKSVLKQFEKTSDSFDGGDNPLLVNYKYINADMGKPKTVTFQSPLFEAYSPSVRGAYSPRKSVDFLMSLHPFDFFLSHPGFADEYVTDFVDDCVLTDFVPDLLMEVLDTWSWTPKQIVNTESAADIYDTCLLDVITDLVKESCQELAVGYVNASELNRNTIDPLEEFLNEVTDAAVVMATAVVVRETVQDMAGEIIESSAAGAFILSQIDEIVHEIQDELIEDVKWEITAEAAIDDLVVWPEVTELIIDVATETLRHYDNKVYRRELREVKNLANEKLVDSNILDHLLSIIAHQGHIWTEDALSNKTLDSAILNVLLEQMFHITKQRSRTLHNSAMRKLHKTATTNVALDLFLEQLSASLDEDMADIDEYERGLTHTTPDNTSVLTVSEGRKSVVSTSYSGPGTLSPHSTR